MLISVLIIFILAALAPLVVRLAGDKAGWLLALGPAGVVVYLLCRWPAVVDGAIRESLNWVPAFGVELAMVGDGLSVPMAVLVAGIGALIVIYAGGYMHGDPRIGKFFAYLLLFMGAMLGLVLCDNLIALFIFWELTSISSYLLIGFNHDSKDNRDAALKALVVTGGGGLALLAGIVLLAIMGQSLGLSPAEALSISALVPHAEAIKAHALYTPMLLLILAGCFTKSAQVPFHFWLPAAMAGPTPVSAYLHSATMVKAGVFLLARMHPTLGGTGLWVVLVTSVGCATMLLGAIIAIGHRDLKGILAFTTVSVLGTLVMLLGIGTDAAIKAAVVFLFAHGLYKATLFMIAGNVDHGTGTRDVTRLGGLRHVMGFTATAAVLAAFSQAGIPPFFGYLGKKVVFEAKIGVETLGAALIGLAVVANICMVAVALLIAFNPFWGKAESTPHEPHEAPPSMLIGPMILSVLGVIIGLVPGVFDATFGTAMATAIRGTELVVKLKLMFGLDAASLIITGLSFGALGLGYLLYRKLRKGIHVPAAIMALRNWGPDINYTRGLDALMAFAAWHTRIIQAGYLRIYLLIVVAAFVAAVGPAVLLATDLGRLLPLDPIMTHELVLALLIVAGAIYATFADSRLAAVAAMGGSGIGIALLFAIFGAIDLAITQLMVETLMVILLVMVFRRMPRLKKRSANSARLRDAAIALAGGAVVALMVLASATVNMPAAVSDYYLEKSVPEAYGRNVVNVILVDFRALDTLGEITVVAIAGVGVAALVWAGLARGRRPQRVEGGAA